jgi:hypothetical protein
VVKTGNVRGIGGETHASFGGRWLWCPWAVMGVLLELGVVFTMVAVESVAERTGEDGGGSRRGWTEDGCDGCGRGGRGGDGLREG